MFSCDKKRRPKRSPSFPWQRAWQTSVLVSIVMMSLAAIAQPPVRSGCEIDYPPFSIVGEDGDATGFSVALLRAALAAMNREVTFRTGTWAEVRGWLERGEIDALPLVGRTPERDALFDFTFPYMSLHGAIVVRDEVTDIRTMDDLRGRRVAVMQGDNAEEFLRREERGIAIHTTPTFEDALRELAEGRHDAVVIQRLVALRLIQQAGLKNLRVIEMPIEGFRQDFSFAVTKGDQDTLALLNEGLAIAVADGTYRYLYAKWFAALELPTERPIVVGGDHNYPPFEYLNDRGHPEGYSVDLTRAIAAEMGLDIEIRLGLWHEVVQGLEEGAIDIIQGMFYSPERDLKFNFTQPHDLSHYVGVTRKGEAPPPISIADLAGKRIVAQRGDAVHDYLLEHGLGDQVTLVDTQEDVLRELAEGLHDCALAVRVSSLHVIDKNGWTNLDLGHQPFLSMEYCYAALSERRALLAQFSEGLKVVEMSGEYRRIHEKWLGVYREEQPSSLVVLRQSAKFLVPLLAVLALAFLWSWSLSRRVAERTGDLRESMDRFQYFFESSNVGKSITLPTGEITVNKAYAEFVGYGQEELKGKTWQDLTPPEDVEAAERKIKPLLEGREDSARFEKRYVHKDGRCLWADVSTRLRCDEKGTPLYFVTAVVDITERKLAVEALRSSEEFQRALIACSPVALYSIDADGIVLSWNQSAERIFGWSADEVIGNPLPIVPEVKREESAALRHKTMRGEGFDNKELTRQRKDGTLFPISLSVAPIRDDDGVVAGIMAAAEDITERKQAEKREQHLTDVLRAIRNVNQLIIHEKDPDALLRATCKILIETRGYRSAWIGLRDAEGGMRPAAESGLEGGLEALRTQLERGIWPRCCRQAMEHPDVVATHNTMINCVECPLAYAHRDTTALASALRHEGREYGVLVVAPKMGNDPQEQALFRELAEDIGYALYGIEMEQQRIKAEDALRENERFARATIDALSAHLCVLDEEGTILSVNRAWRAFAEANGAQSADVSENGNYFRVCEAVSGDDRDCAIRFLDGIRAVVSGARDEFSLEYPCHSPSEERWFVGRVTRLAGDGPIRVVMAHENVTKRKQAEDALAENERQYRLLADNTLDVIWTMSPETIFTYANPAIAELTGHTPEEWVGSGLRDHCDGIQFARMTSLLEQEIAKGPEHQGVVFETEMLRRDGTPVAVEIHSRVFFDAEFRPTTVQGVTRNITERKRMEKERRKLQSQLNQAQRMESIGQLAGGVAHDFNNILQAMIGYSSMLLERFDEGSELYDFTMEVINGAERAASLTRQLLAFSRRQVLELEALDLNDMVRGISKMLRRLIGEHIEMTFNEGQAVGAVRADRAQMEQVLLNLCINARDAMPEGGVLAIETEEVTLDDEYCVSHVWARPGRYVFLAVTDSGCGMDKETMERAFEPFFTTKELGCGTGLGLATVYGIVKQHNGMIQAYSEVGEGTQFNVFLPVIDEPVSTAEPGVAEPLVGGTETILLAEDDPVLRSLCERVLSDAGYTVLAAADGHEAIEVFESHGNGIAMVVLDVVMPKMGGRAVYDALRTKAPYLRFLFSSGYSTGAIHTEFVAREGVDFIQKPYSLHVLLRKVREILDIEADDQGETA